MGKNEKIDIDDWRVEDPQFWEQTGQSVATRNLWISIPSLLCGFAVWMYWSVVTVQMLNLGFPFSPQELFTLAGIAGLSGATLRIPSSFLIRLCGGRNTIFITTVLLMIPAVGTGYALKDLNTPLWVFQLMALFSGFGGGNFASSMSNISFFYPKKNQGYALGINAGLGNFGVTTMQILIPLVMTIPLFGGTALPLLKASGTLIGKIPAGQMSYIHNAGFIWLPLLLVVVIFAFIKMNNLRTATISPTPQTVGGSTLIITGLLGMAMFTSSMGSYFMIVHKFNKWLIIPLVILATVMLMKTIPGNIKVSLDRQFKIFGEKHNWIMTVIYIMTFGSFIGFSAAFPLAIEVIFGMKHILVNGVWDHSQINPNGPSALSYAWLGPFIGALVRPIGGKISDKFGGAFVTQFVSITMVFASIAAGYYMQLAYSTETPEQYFNIFFVLFLVLFLSSGLGNGSTFRTIAVIFEQEKRGPVLGWTSAVAAYGAFLIPTIFGEQIKATTPQYALYGFAVFYAFCTIVNWWFYLGPKREFDNP